MPFSFSLMSAPLLLTIIGLLALRELYLYFRHREGKASPKKS